MDRSVAQGPAGVPARDDLDIGRPATRTARWLIVAVGVGLAVLAFGIYSASRADRLYDHFVWQAAAFLEGQAAIRYPVEGTAGSAGNWFFQDVLPIMTADGVPRGLLPFPPLPALILVPFVAFLGAEAIDASGVLAVVTAGIVVSQVAPKLDRAETRQQVRAFWSFLTYLLNGALFVLVGIEAMIAARALDGGDLLRATGIIVAVAVLLVVVRFAFLNAAGGTVWLVTRKTGGQPREGHRDRLVSGFAGFRGAVSLAMAVAVPRTLESGAAFPDRDLIVFVTAGVVVLTVVGQALVLPAVLRRAALPEDESVGEERRYAERTAIEEALDALPRLAREAGADRTIVDRVRKDYEAHLDVIRAREEAEDDEHPALQRHDAAVALELALVQHKAATLLRLRDADEIDDLVLRQVRAGYDAEEARLEGSTPP